MAHFPRAGAEEAEQVLTEVHEVAPESAARLHNNISG